MITNGIWIKKISVKDFEHTDNKKSKEEDIPKNSMEVGDYIEFGHYPQTEDGTDQTPIKWKVLEVKENKVLVISEDGLDTKKYNDELADTTWEDCSLRQWLNNDFLNIAFSTREQSKIQSTMVSVDKNPEFDTNPGNNTYDKIFLLSINEVEEYFSFDMDRTCAPTAFAIAQGADFGNEVNEDDEASFWWLRSPGLTQCSAAFVSNDCSVYHFGYLVNDEGGCVCPALWINLESSNVID